MPRVQPTSRRRRLPRDLYKEATGRFPQASSDRKEVFVRGFWLVGAVFVATLGFALTLLLADKAVPDWTSVFATAIGSGVIGGFQFLTENQPEAGQAATSMPSLSC